MKKLLLILFIFISTIIYSQSKYFIYFKDKGVSAEQSLSKSHSLYKEAVNALSKQAVERRLKVMGEDYITYQDLPLSLNYVSQLESKGIVIKHQLKWFNAVSVYLTNEQIDEISKLDFIDKIERVKTFVKKPISDNVNKTLSKQSSTNNSYNYGLSLTQNEMSDIPIVHDYGFSGQNVVLGLLDTGFDWKDHPALKNRNVLRERDFVFNDYNTADESEDIHGQSSHGTAVFSAAGGFDEGELIGPAFDATFILGKTENIVSERRVEEDNYAAALEWMEGLGADIISSSLGYSKFDTDDESYTYRQMDGKTTIVTKAAEIAFERGILMITSAGNEGNDPWKYITAPGDGFNVITIGAVTSNNERSYFSSFGPSYDGRIKPELTALGSNVRLAQNSKVSQYKNSNGTSFAAPIVAGIAAQLKSAHPYLTNTQMRAILIESGDYADKPNNEIGYGLVSALRAIEYPNIKELEDGTLQINKLIIEDEVLDNSVKIHYTIGEDEFVEEIMNSEDGKRFTFNFPSIGAEENYKVYFTYKKVGDNSEVRFPETGGLKLLNDDNILSYNYFPYGIAVPPGPTIPVLYNLEQNYPNPFNPKTTISYTLEKDGFVNLSVYNILGEKVTTLVNEQKEAGIKYNAVFDNVNLSSGVYIYRLEVNGFTKSKKMMLIK